MRGHMTYADAHRYSTPVDRPGDKVWLSTRDLCLHLPCQKLSPRYIGPFTIETKINEVTFRLQLHPEFHVSLLKPVSPSVTEPKEPAVPPPPEIIEEPVVYRVQGILDSWRRLVVYVVGHQEPPLVEGVLSESPQSLQSTAMTLTRSQSPEF